MQKRGIADFSLDWGRCPRWLFERMTKLGQEIIRITVEEYGPEEFIYRLADPVWFQSLGTVLAFDWNASGLTTTLTAALKQAVQGREQELGIFICGGKGKTSRKTPEEIINWAEQISMPNEQTKSLVYNSKMTAKVDSSLIQDGFQIYHHSFFFSKSGSWTVVQQGMNTLNQTARRYHWHSDKIKDLVCEPHKGIISQNRINKVLNLVAEDSAKTRTISTELVQRGYKSLKKDFTLLRYYSSSLVKTITLSRNNEQIGYLHLANKEFQHHQIEYEKFFASRYLHKILWQLCEIKPKSYEDLLAVSGVGPKTIRALALVSELIYGARPSFEDPARYSFAHGGKDGTPFFVNSSRYDKTIEILRRVVKKTRIDISEKKRILKKL